MALGWCMPLWAACVDQAAAAAPMRADEATGRAALQQLVQQALSRSQGVGAARLLADAALRDIDEARAAQALQVNATAGLGPSASHSDGVASSSWLQARAGLSMGRLIADGGRTEQLIDWRAGLADAARLGWVGSQEQVALSAVALALERSRWLQQADVYAQYVSQMTCLVGSLEQVVAADRGRLSELVQARKSMQQAELSQAQAAAQGRQVEVKLRRLAGEVLPGAQALGGLLRQVPALPSLQAEVLQSAEIAQLDAQARASRHLAQAVQAGLKPQLSWTLSANASAAGGGSANRGGTLSAGLAINIPLLSPGVEAAADAARQRAQALLLSRDDAVEQRQARLAELHEQGLAALDRARRVADVLRDSDRVRDFTLQQWQQLGRRSLFDVMAAESEHYNLRIAEVNALHDGQQAVVLMQALGRGLRAWLQ